VTDDNHLLDRDDVAEYLATSENHVRRLTRRGELPVVVVGNRHRYRLADVDEFIGTHRQVVGQSPTRAA
jgi:excisionase family DNA binding protein